MKTGYKILLSVALAPTMSLLLIYYMFGVGGELDSLLLVHILTIIGTRFLVKRDCYHIVALCAGFVLTAYAWYAYERNQGSGIMPFFFTFIITYFYVLPAMLFATINIYLAQRKSK